MLSHSEDLNLTKINDDENDAPDVPGMTGNMLLDSSAFIFFFFICIKLT